MDVHEAVRTRRSVRSYRRDPIPEEVLNRVLEAARVAPSAGNG
jgi:nitroreductase